MTTSFLIAFFIIIIVYTSYNICCAFDINEGDGSIEYFFDKDLLNEYPDGSCFSTHFKCYGDENNIIQTFKALTPYDCCKSCLANNECKAWNHFYTNATNGTEYISNDNPQCQLFSTFNNDSNHIYAANCVYGVPYLDKNGENKRPNFIFYYPDTIRMDSLQIYNHPLDTTPNMKSFMNESGSVQFNNHIAQHSQCTPSRTAMITGRYMHTLGHRTQQHLTQYWEPNYFRWFKDNGYFVLWLGKNDALSKTTFPLSVNQWEDKIGVAMGPQPFPFGTAGYYSFFREATETPGNSTKNGDYSAIQAAQQFLKQNNYSPPQPFVIFIPGKGGHPPYGAPKGYYDKFSVDDVKKAGIKLRPFNPENKPKFYNKNGGIPDYRNLTTLNDTFFYQINAIYLGRMYYMDWLFGELWNSIKQFDDKTNTTTNFFMSSDHGDFQGDSKLVEKWPGSLDDMLIRIPLIARVGGNKINNGNTKIKMATQSFDIFETMIDIANISITWNRNGISLRDQLINGNDGDLNKYVYSEGGFYYHNELYPNGSDHINNGPKNDYYPRAQEEMSDNGNGSPRCVMIRNVFYKLVFRPLGISEFYDLKNDPKQLNNLFYNQSISNDLQIIKQNMLFNLTSWYVQTADVTPILMDPRGVPHQVPN